MLKTISVCSPCSNVCEVVCILSQETPYIVRVIPNIVTADLKHLYGKSYQDFAIMSTIFSVDIEVGHV